MTGPIRQLSTDEVLGVLEGIDPVGLVVQELGGPVAGGRPRPEPHGRLTPWRGGTSARGVPPAELSLLEDLRIGGRCLLPTATLSAVRGAALVALAARELVTPGVVTAAVLGCGDVAQPGVMLISRQLSGLSHLAVGPVADGTAGPVTPRLLDQLDLAGIGLSVTATVAEAVFGATLVVATAAGLDGPTIGQLSRGALVINTAGEDLPDDLVDAVDQIYVDDFTLVAKNSHRYFIRAHLAEPDIGARPTGRTAGRHRRHIEADLRQLVTSTHAGRTNVDDVLLVELLSADALDVRLACTLHEAALERGLGVRLVE